jgi:RNA polymerase sigma-B factor
VSDLSSLETRKAEARVMFARMAELPEDDPERLALRDRTVELHLPLAEHLARRFSHRGEPHDDLVQVANIGLIKAVDRFEVERGLEFSTYATPTIVGEIKRHFRDKTWAVRVPRRLQELRLSMTQATADLSQSLERSPTVAELAERLGVGEDDVIEALEAGGAYSTIPLDAERDDDSPGPSLSDTLGIEDGSFETVENLAALKPLLAALPVRERKILLLRFFESKTQSEIAAELGISQMHVSRLLARTLEQLREGMLTNS